MIRSPDNTDKYEAKQREQKGTQTVHSESTVALKKIPEPQTDVSVPGKIDEERANINH